MSLLRRFRRAGAGTIALVIAVLVAAGSLAVAAIPSGNGQLTACLSVVGTMRVVDTERGAFCNTTERTLKIDSFGGPAGGDLTGTYPNPQLAIGSVGTAEIANGAIRSDDIGVEQVGNSELAVGAVTTNKILDGAIRSQDIGAGQVGTGQLADGAVTTNKLAGNAVDSAKILNGSVNGTDLADEAVTREKIRFASILPHHFGSVYYRSKSRSTEDEDTSLQVSCDDGDMLVSGGASVSDNDGSDDAVITVSAPNSLNPSSGGKLPDTWRASISLDGIIDDIDGFDSATVGITIYCLDNGA